MVNLKDILAHWESGMKLYSPMFGDVEFEGITNEGYVRIKTSQGCELFHQDGKFSAFGECMLFPSATERDWNKFVPPIKRGDVVVADCKTCIQMFVVDKLQSPGVDVIIGFDFEDNLIFNSGNYFYNRRATEEEAQKLFSTLKEYGYEWNSEDNTIINVGTKFDHNTLKPFDQVLVRDCDTCIWYVSLFGCIDNYSEAYPYVCSGTSYKQCVPYNEDTKHLIGTTNPCPNNYKNW